MKNKQITIRDGHTKTGAEIRRFAYYKNEKGKIIFSDYIHNMLKDCKILDTYYYANGDITISYKDKDKIEIECD